MEISFKKLNCKKFKTNYEIIKKNMKNVCSYRTKQLLFHNFNTFSSSTYFIYFVKSLQRWYFLFLCPYNKTIILFRVKLTMPHFSNNKKKTKRKFYKSSKRFHHYSQKNISRQKDFILKISKLFTMYKSVCILDWIFSGNFQLCEKSLYQELIHCY